jgi:hypothetical protein
MLRANRVVLVACLLSCSALAQTDPAAESLFVEGTKLLAEKKYDAACPKLEESHRLAPKGGTLMNLAKCHAESGKTATAWAEYRAAAAQADRDGRKERAREANDNAQSLEAQLAHLTIEVLPAVRGLAGLSVTRGGVELGAGAFGMAVPTDPGVVEVRASAKGYRPWSSKVDVTAKAQKTVTVAELVPEPAAPPEASAAPPPAALPPAAPSNAPPRPAPPEPDRSSSSSQKTIGYVAGGIGVVGLVAGVVFSLRAKSKDDDARSAGCTDTTCKTSEGLDASNASRWSGQVATVAWVLGGVGVAAGAVLVITAPSESAPVGKLWVAPRLGREGGGLGLGGAW